MASTLPPVRGAAFSFAISLVSQADTDTFQDNPTLAAGDVKVVKDGTLDDSIDSLPTAVTSLTRVLNVSLSATEMTADRVDVLFHDAAGAEWQDALVTIYTAAQTLDTTDGVADTISGIVGHTDYGNAKLVRATTPANTLAVAATGEASANVTYWKGDAVPTPTVDGVPETRLADTAHGGSNAFLLLTGVTIQNLNPYAAGITVSLPGEGTKGIDITASQDIVANLEGTIGGLTTAALAQFVTGDTGETAATAGSVAALAQGGSSIDPADIAAALNAVEQPTAYAGVTPSGALKDVYDDNAIDALSDVPPTEDAALFSSFVMQADGDDLYIGLSISPMNGTAATIAKITAIDGVTLPTHEYTLPEEGVSAMCVGPDGKLYVAGVDERLNTGVSSIYVRSTSGTWTRLQTVTAEQHITDISFEAGTTRLVICGQGSVDSVRYSEDYGATWTGAGHPFGRVYSARSIGTILVQQGTDDFLTYGVAWGDLINSGGYDTVAGITGGVGRMVTWGSLLAGVSATNHIYTVNSSHVGTEYDVPFTLAQLYNNLAVDSAGFLCALSSTGEVWRTGDLVTWRKVWVITPPGTACKAIAAWGDDLVVSTSGALAAIYRRPAAQSIEAVSTALAVVDSTANAILADTSAIDYSAITTTSHYSAGAITLTVTETFSETVSGLTIPATWEKVLFTVKAAGADADSAALLQIAENNPGAGTDGLIYLNGATIASPITYADGQLTVSQAGGTVAILITDNALSHIGGNLSGYIWDLKAVTSAGMTKVLTTGTLATEWTATKAIA